MLKIGSLQASVKIVEKEEIADMLGPQTNLLSPKRRILGYVNQRAQPNKLLHLTPR